jgi:hypothetical protein
MFDHRRSKLDAFVDPCPHQDNSASRGIHFLSQEQIARARRQTEPAMNALVHQGFEWFQFRESLFQSLKPTAQGLGARAQHLECRADRSEP